MFHLFKSVSPGVEMNLLRMITQVDNRWNEVSLLPSFSVSWGLPHNSQQQLQPRVFSLPRAFHNDWLDDLDLMLLCNISKC